MIITIPPYTWIDLYQETGITVGTALVLRSYVGNINIANTATAPPDFTINSINYPLPLARTVSTLQSAGAPGVWASSDSPNQWTLLSVETSGGSMSNTIIIQENGVTINSAATGINFTGGVIVTNGSIVAVDVTGGSGTAAGSNYQIQFNENDAFGASPSLFWNYDTDTLSIDGNVTVNNNLIQDVSTPVLGTDAANKDYVDAASGSSAQGPNTAVQYNINGAFTGDADFLWNPNTQLLSLNGEIDLNNNLIVNLGDPISDDNAVNKGYADTYYAPNLYTQSGIATIDLNTATGQINLLSDPSNQYLNVAYDVSTNQLAINLTNYAGTTDNVYLDQYVETWTTTGGYRILSDRTLLVPSSQSIQYFVDTVSGTGPLTPLSSFYQLTSDNTSIGNHWKVWCFLSDTTTGGFVGEYKLEMIKENTDNSTNGNVVIKYEFLLRS